METHPTTAIMDVAIIGAGPGGYVTAIRAAQLGFKTAVIEKKHLGGICLNWGCIPTKALLRSADIYRHMQHASEYGLQATAGFDLDAIVNRSRTVSAQLTAGVAHLLKKNKITVIDGDATVLPDQEVAIKHNDGNRSSVRAKHIIIATGAHPRVLPGLEPDGERIWTYFEALRPKTLPNSMLVMGSGAIGIEFAGFYSALGVQVTVVEVMDRVLPVEDAEISAVAEKAFKKQGMTILTRTKVARLDKTPHGITAHLSLADGKAHTVTADVVISAVGVEGNCHGLGLEALGVKTARGCIVTDDYSRTTVAGVYAIGDVAGPPMLAHKAEHEGVVCIEKIADLPDVQPLDHNKIPGCTYCHPQVASVGLTEQAAKEAGYDLHVGRFPLIGNGKAVAMGEAEGLIKTIFDAKTGQLLGAHMIGAEVTELIQGFVIAMGLETTEAELMHTVFPHPTLSEAMHESVLEAYGKVIHL